MNHFYLTKQFWLTKTSFSWKSLLISLINLFSYCRVPVHNGGVLITCGSQIARRGIFGRFEKLAISIGVEVYNLEFKNRRFSFPLYGWREFSVFFNSSESIYEFLVRFSYHLFLSITEARNADAFKSFEQCSCYVGFLPEFGIEGIIKGRLNAMRNPPRTFVLQHGVSLPSGSMSEVDRLFDDCARFSTVICWSRVFERINAFRWPRVICADDFIRLHASSSGLFGFDQSCQKSIWPDIKVLSSDSKSAEDFSGIVFFSPGPDYLNFFLEDTLVFLRQNIEEVECSIFMVFHPSVSSLDRRRALREFRTNNISITELSAFDYEVYFPNVLYITYESGIYYDLAIYGIQCFVLKPSTIYGRQYEVFDVLDVITVCTNLNHVFEKQVRRRDPERSTWCKQFMGFGIDV